MVCYLPHEYDQMTLSQARIIQQTLAAHVSTIDTFNSITYVAGVDVGYNKNTNEQIAAAVLFDTRTNSLIETVLATRPILFPYIPGFLSFREIPVILEALKKLSVTPDLLICDGHGIAHPRRLGIASHLGVLLDMPTIGCAKKILVGTVDETLAEQRGAQVPLIYKQECLGMAVRTRTHCKPVYVSTGHRISLATSVAWIITLATRYRLPDPTHYADKAVKDRYRVKKSW